ncbi:MAG TPA: hypothetical protein VGK16_01670 [Candidatus Limnocylindrales bacterium]|jgi:hypothetical protein
MDRDDPRNDVEAPVRRALLSLVARGAALVGVVLVLVLAPGLPLFAPAPGLDDIVAIAVPLLLFAYGAAVLVDRRRHGRPPEEAREAAWFRARAIEPADAMLALLVAGWVPVALLAALVVLAWPHLNDPSPATRGVWGAFGAPALAASWLVAANLWLEATRDKLARAIGESEHRFRSYWANPRG